MPEGGAEYARVVYGIASAPGEIPRPLYEARECEPPFDTLPTKEEHEAAQASKSDEADSGEVATVRSAPKPMLRLRTAHLILPKQTISADIGSRFLAHYSAGYCGYAGRTTGASAT